MLGSSTKTTVDDPATKDVTEATTAVVEDAATLKSAFIALAVISVAFLPRRTRRGQGR